MPGTRRTMRTGPRRAATAAAAHRQAMSTRAATVTHRGAGAMWCAASGIGITAPGDACGLGQCAALHHALAAALVMARWNVWSRLLDLPRDAFPFVGPCLVDGAAHHGQQVVDDVLGDHPDLGAGVDAARLVVGEPVDQLVAQLPLTHCVATLPSGMAAWVLLAHHEMCRHT